MDLTTGTEAEPALTLVFDREGWSPAVFRRLARRGIAVLTWHKNFRGADWPETDSGPPGCPCTGPGGTRTLAVRLAEQRVRLLQGPEVRQISRLLDDGRQLALITTNFRLPREQAAGVLFSRWSQENFSNTCGKSSSWTACPCRVWPPKTRRPGSSIPPGGTKTGNSAGCATDSAPSAIATPP